MVGFQQESASTCVCKPSAFSHGLPGFDIPDLHRMCLPTCLCGSVGSSISALALLFFFLRKKLESRSPAFVEQLVAPCRFRLDTSWLPGDTRLSRGHDPAVTSSMCVPMEVLSGSTYPVVPGSLIVRCATTESRSSWLSTARSAARHRPLMKLSANHTIWGATHTTSAKTLPILCTLWAAQIHCKGHLLLTDLRSKELCRVFQQHEFDRFRM